MFSTLEGIAVPSFSGGPLVGGGTTVVGVIVSGTPPVEGQSSIFQAISVEHIPSLREAPVMRPIEPGLGRVPTSSRFRDKGHS